MKCFNLSREEAIRCDFAAITPEAYAWVSINEPGNDETKSEILDTLHKLKISFWDIVQPTRIIGSDEIVQPPTEEDAKRIVDFILDNKEKNIVVNCRAGKGRSGAICQFLNEMLKYEWDDAWKNRAVPNKLLFENMVKYFHQLGYSKPTTIIDKRRQDYLAIK